ncbi:cytochrome C biogenesis protein CcdA [Methylobacterium sp. Leaf399]|uniref:cytochrome c maturation protein CcmE n=1 Tax=unclassified Methylobacterium TaxID=2615210 RepID=UPI0006FFD8FD|nr:MULTISPECIES: cytochrome c maturation protein CcmE [unclassified Methylobacterium]KQP61706.1 cytochrome C biogenesis protein CcdA [Methylobacterium sp. Leaf108]KQT19972.1 cytochrome C biogenesis protein CcdA [Methylobacterium sp. Leaf399]KQT78491.1 cytochrome C biogenesis protein CcdA [Methylobacterium sp. Leaf466]
MTRKSRRLIMIAVCGGVLALALGLILSAMSGSIVFFRSPTEVAQNGVAPGTRFRLGGLVQDGTLKRGPDQTVDFTVTDTNATVAVQYRGLLPDLFREGQGVVAEGTLIPGGIFKADTVLAKHDESYMPREVADALKAQGRWQEGGAKPASGNGPASATKAAPAGEATLGPRTER